MNNFTLFEMSKSLLDSNYKCFFKPIKYNYWVQVLSLTVGLYINLFRSPNQVSFSMWIMRYGLGHLNL